MKAATLVSAPASLGTKLKKKHQIKTKSKNQIKSKSKNTGTLFFGVFLCFRELFGVFRSFSEFF